MIRIIIDTEGYTTGATYAMMGACWNEDYSVQYDWHAINDAGILSIIPFGNAQWA